MGPYGERLAFLDEHDALLNALAAGVACIRRGADGHWVQIDTHETDTEDILYIYILYTYIYYIFDFDFEYLKSSHCIFNNCIE